MIITFVWYEFTDLTITGELSVVQQECDGSSAPNTIIDTEAHNITFTRGAGKIETSRTISSSDVDADNSYLIYWENTDADIITLVTIQIEYYIKRSL